MNKRLIIVVGIVAIVISLWAVVTKKNSARPSAASAAAAPRVEKLYEVAVDLKKDGDALKAREVFQRIVQNHPDADNIATVQKELEELNMDIIFSNLTVPGKTVLHEVVPGDTLGKIAKQYGTTVELIKRINKLKSDVIRLGQKLRIWQGNFNVFVDKSQNILILKDSNEIVKIYPVSTGKDNSTPVGEFKVATKLIDPVWFNRGAVVPPESPENVLGSRWLGFDYAGYGIHGTIEPETIGSQVTAGCVRMYNEDVEELYEMLPMGTEVVIVD